MSRRRRISLKLSGRKKVTFHLDQLVFFSETPYDPKNKWAPHTYEFQCEMIESGARRWGTGVMCGHTEIDFLTLEAAAEAALTHIQEMHQASGGVRLPKDRGRARRERERDEWNARRVAEANRGGHGGSHQAG